MVPRAHATRREYQPAYVAATHRSAARDGGGRVLSKVRRCPIIAASTPSSLRAQRSNPGATARGPWIASSQGLLAMTDGVIHVPQVDFLNSGPLLGRCPIIAASTP